MHRDEANALFYTVQAAMLSLGVRAELGAQHTTKPA